MDNYAWTVALTRMISAVFRRGGDVSFVVEELKAVFDPRGGYWVAGRYVPSLLAAIGDVIEQHMISIGFILSSGGTANTEAAEQLNVVNLNAQHTHTDEAPSAPPKGAAHGAARGTAMRQCPKCGQAGLIRQENCDLCTDCGYSKCG
jgi:ribonucleoside-diphosphate reductase alpha chain